MTFFHSTSPLKACPNVTAGLRCAPDTPPATYTPNATATPQPHPTITPSPPPSTISAALPEPYIPATSSPTSPSPTTINTHVPNHSDTISPQSSFLQFFTFFSIAVIYILLSV